MYGQYPRGGGRGYHQQHPRQYPQPGYQQQGYGYPAGNPYGQNGAQVPYQAQNPYNTPNTNPATGQYIPSVYGIFGNGRWEPSPRRIFFTSHPYGQNYEYVQWCRGEIVIPVYQEIQRPSVSARNRDQPVRSASQRTRQTASSSDDEDEEDNDDDGDDRGTISTDESTRSSSRSSAWEARKRGRGGRSGPSGSSRPRPRTTSISIEDVEDALRISAEWVTSCERRAKEFGKTRSLQERERASAIQCEAFDQWAWHSITQVMMIRETPNQDDNAPDVQEAGEFSFLSPSVAVLARYMTRIPNVVAITFFCGSYRETRGHTKGLKTTLLRSFCHQLVGIDGLDFDLENSVYSTHVLSKLREGNPKYLQTFFEDLVVDLSKSGGTLVCFIDGVHIIDNEEIGFEEFSRTFEAFTNCFHTGRENRNGFNFKVLLTMPQQSNSDWDLLNNGEIVTLHV